MIRRILFGIALSSVFCSAATPPGVSVVDLTAADGTKLKATYFAAGKSGPGVLLMHQCNRDRKMWDDLAPKLAATGLNVLTLDFRGFGESGGSRVADATPQEAGKIFAQFPADVDIAYQYLISQPGVKKDIIGAGGASCGVNQSIQLAKRHPQVKSLVLLSGNTDRIGRQFLHDSPLPLFGAAADDDPGAVDQMTWILSLSANSGTQFQHYQNGGHGIEMFAPHPELSGLIVNWFDTTLRKTPGRAPENKSASFRLNPGALAVLDSPGGAAKVNDMLAQARQKDPKAQVFPEFAANIVGYEHLQSGDIKGAIEVVISAAKR